MSAARTALHDLVDRLPEDALHDAAEALAGLELTQDVEAGIRRGLDAARRGELVSGAEVFSALRARLPRTAG